MAAQDNDTKYLGGLSVKEAAAYADVHDITIRRWIEDGLLPAFYVGRRVRIKLSDLKALRRPYDPDGG